MLDSTDLIYKKKNMADAKMLLKAVYEAKTKSKKFKAVDRILKNLTYNYFKQDSIYDYTDMLLDAGIIDMLVTILTDDYSGKGELIVNRAMRIIKTLTEIQFLRDETDTSFFTLPLLEAILPHIASEGHTVSALWEFFICRKIPEHLQPAIPNVVDALRSRTEYNPNDSKALITKDLIDQLTSHIHLRMIKAARA